MPLQYLLDENLRGLLWTAIVRHNIDAEYPIDAVRVGDPSDLPSGSKDSEILIWCERNERLLVSVDRSTLDSHLRRHLANGSHLPGVFLIKSQVSLRTVVEFLVVAAHASDLDEWRDKTWFIP